MSETNQATQANAKTASDLVDELALIEAWPDPDLLDAILDTGDEAVAPLIALVTRFADRMNVPGGTGAATTTNRDDADDEDVLSALATATGFAVDLLGTLGSPDAIGPLVRLFYAGDDDLTDSLEDVLTRLGPGVIAPVLAVAADASLPWYPRTVASNAAVRAAANDPSCRAQIADALRPLLAGYVARAEAAADPENAFSDDEQTMISTLVGDLSELADPEARPLIEQAFAKNLVDLMFIRPHHVDDMYRDVRPPRPLPPARQWLDRYRNQFAEHAREQRREAIRLPAEPLAEAHTKKPAVRRKLPGRNDPCWCGSGKKYKKCHLYADQQQQQIT